MTENSEQTPESYHLLHTHTPININSVQIQEQSIIEYVLRMSLEEENRKTFSENNGLNLKHLKLIKSMKMGRSKQTCSVCLSGFVQQQVIKKLPCGHIFHRDCAKQWLKVNKRCPLCRLDLEQHFKKSAEQEQLKQVECKL